MKLLKKDMRDLGKVAQKKEQKSETKIFVYRIKRVHPKIVNVNVADEVEVVLPIKQDMYMKLVKIVNDNPKKQHWYPFVFWLDAKGYVTDIIPLRIIKEREREEKEE